MLINKKAKTSNQKGFTLIEMLVIAPIVILTIGAFVSVIINMTGDVLSARGSNVLSYNIQDALNRIEQDVKLSTGFLATNNISFDAVNNPQGFDYSTSNFTNVDANPTVNGDMLILNTLATTGNPQSLGSGVVYLNNTPNDCSNNAAQVNQNKPMTMNIVYFIKNGSLWRRTITPVDYLTTGATTSVCSPNPTPWQRPSCNPDHMSTFCKTEDIKLVDVSSVTDFSIEYFNGANSTTANSDASDPAIMPASTRNSQLQSATTITASLNISKTIAGRTISQSGSIKVTRLDVNAATIADVVPDTAPSAPTVTASQIDPSTPTNVTFTWPTVPNAKYYTFEYQKNSTAGAWTVGLSGQPLNSYTVIDATHNDVIYFRAKASSPLGQWSGYSAVGQTTIPLWAPMLLQNSWINYDSTNTRSPATFTKTSSGTVMLKGIVKSGTVTGGTIIATLPFGYRPAYPIVFQNPSNNAAGRVDIMTDGTIKFQVGSATWFGLDGINFMSSGTGNWNLLSLQNSWVDFQSPYTSPLSYMVDTAGRTRLSGMIKNGTTTSGTVISNIPSQYSPPLYIHISMDANNTNGHYSVDPSNNAIVAKGANNGWYSIQGLFYPAGRTASASCPVATGGWCALTFQNSWKNYLASTYSTGAYTKGNDGVVQLKGLLNGGTIGTVVANLPAGYRPAHRLLIAIESADAFGTVDIAANGDIIASIGSASWVSLDSVNFLAEQ